MESKKPALFYFNVNDEQKGPFPTIDIPTMLSKGELRADTMVWADGMVEWQPLKNAFAEHLPSPPPLAKSSQKTSVVNPDFKKTVAEKANTCKVCGALVEANATACECCGVDFAAEASAEGSCPDCKTSTHAGQWFCVECYCPLTPEDKKFAKMLEKHTYKMNNALAGVPQNIRSLLETGDETLEYISGDWILTNKRIFRYGDPNDSARIGTVVGLGLAGAIAAAWLFSFFDSGVLGFFTGGIGGCIGGVQLNKKNFGYKKFTILNSTILEDITTDPDAQSAHRPATYVGDVRIAGSDSYWVQFDSLQGLIRVPTGDFDEALTLAHRIRDAIDAHSSNDPSALHTLSMVIRRMKSKGIPVKGAISAAANDIAA